MTLSRERKPIVAETMSASSEELRGRFDAVIAHNYSEEERSQIDLLTKYGVHIDTLLHGNEATDHKGIRGLEAPDEVSRENLTLRVALALESAESADAKADAVRQAVRDYKTTFKDIAATLPDVDAQGDEVIAAHEDTAETQESLSLRERVGAKLGRFAPTRLFWAGHAKMADFGEKSAAHRAKYAQQDGDSRGERAKKFLIRNRTGIALGTLATLAYSAKLTHSIDHMNDMSGMTDISSLANPDILTQNHDIQFAARSDVLVMTNGRGNGNGNTLRSLADNYGQQGTKTIGVQYPAGIKTPFTPEDSHTYNESSAIAEAQQYNAYAQNKGKSIHFFAYSQGTEATIRTLNRIAAENGGTLPNNVTATIIGGPSVPGGLGDNEYQKALAPILSQFGIDITGDGPKSNGNIRYVTNESDLWGAGGSSSPVDLADKAIGTAFGGTHEYGYNAPSTTVKNPDGSITTTIHGGPMVNSDGYRIRSGIGSALARNQGVHVTREMDEAILAVRGDKDGNYNIPEITDKLARLADQQQPGTGDLVRTALPAVLPQEIADAATSVQNELPRVIASITNPGSLPEPDLSSILGNSQMPAGDTAPTSTYVEPEAAAPVYTAPAPVQQYVAPVQEFVQQTPVQEFIQQAPVQQAIQQAEQALPQQLAPQVAQGKALLGQLGVRLP